MLERLRVTSARQSDARIEYRRAFASQATSTGDEGDLDRDIVPTSGIRDLEAWASERHPTTTFRLRGASPGAVMPLIGEYHRLAGVYHEVAGRIARVVTGDLPTATRRGQPTTWAKSSAPPDSDVPEIVLNIRTFDRLSRVRQHRRDQVARRWHPSGTVAPEALMTHEFGHHVMFWLQDEGFDPVPAIRALTVDRRGLSGYANTRPEEAFSEAFVAHYHGDEDARNHPLTRAVVQFLERSTGLIRERRREP